VLFYYTLLNIKNIAKTLEKVEEMTSPTKILPSNLSDIMEYFPNGSQQKVRLNLISN
jgi:hypothetical protein